jgi:imidazoleglycerol phosphate dehydratase HisB
MSDLVQEVRCCTAARRPRAHWRRRTQHDGDEDFAAAQCRWARKYTVSTGHSLLRSHAGVVHASRRLRPQLKCVGDLDVDQHHTVEDVGIALGEAFAEALGDKKGILRAGYFVMPMDETLASPPSISPAVSPTLSMTR